MNCVDLPYHFHQNLANVSNHPWKDRRESHPTDGKGRRVMPAVRLYRKTREARRVKLGKRYIFIHSVILLDDFK